ncbi:hypothetical protein TIFTF001_017428 [Ficus carica]|uniref:Uncharacterized protein n=1 Tax=Ficus carica TaxID=3494 RepID=A0AA88D9Q3_FICCA|nr:hypothetical protein TIFTF001_017428 [Ficus carica]
MKFLNLGIFSTKVHSQPSYHKIWKVFFVAGSDDNSDVAGRFFVNYATSNHDCIDLLDILSIRSGGLCHMLSHLGGLCLRPKLSSFMNGQDTSQLGDLTLDLFVFFHHLLPLFALCLHKGLQHIFKKTSHRLILGS